MSGPIIPLARQYIQIYICTKLRFEAILRSALGHERLAAINALVTPFIFSMIDYRVSLDVYVFVLI